MRRDWSHDTPPLREALPPLPWWRRWRSVLLGAFLLLAVVGSAGEALDVVRDYRRAEAARREAHADTARALALATDLFVARYVTLTTAAARAVLGGQLEPAVRHRLLAALYAAHPETTSLAVVDADGKGLDRVPVAVVSQVADRDYFRALQRGADWAVSDVLVRRSTGTLAVAVAAASRDAAGRLQGAVVAALPLPALAAALAPELARGVNALVVDRGGRVVVHTAASAAGPADHTAASLAPIADALRGRAAAWDRLPDPLTRRLQVGAAAPVPGLGWAVAVIEPVHEALAAARAQRTRALGIMAAVVAGSVVLALVLGNRLSRPLAALAEGVGALGHGDLGYRVPVRSSSEIGRLARSFNDMADRLEAALTERERSKDEADRLNARLAAANVDLGRRVAELSTLLEVMPIGIAWSEDARCRRVFANPALSSMLGVPPATNISQSAPPGELPPFRLLRDGRPVAPEDLPMQTAARRGVVVANVESEVVRTDGTSLRLLEWAAPVLDERGKVRKVFLAVVDITARTRIEASLRESEARLGASQTRYRALTEVVAQVVWTARAEGRPDDSPQWRALTGQTAEDLAARGWFPALHPDDRSRAAEAWERAVATRTPFDAEFRVRRADGRHAWYASRGVPVIEPDGRVREWIGVCIDIDRRKRAERDLVVLADAGTALTASLDLDTALRALVDLAVRELADWAVVEVSQLDGLLATSAVAHRSPALSATASRLAERFRKGPGPAGGEDAPELVQDVTDAWLESRAKDREHHALMRALGAASVLLIPLGAHGRRLGRLVLVSADPARRYAEADLALANGLAERAALAAANALLYREAQAAAAARDAFLARASHELRTPLTSAVGGVRLARKALAGQMLEPPAPLLDIASRNLDAMLALINDLLDASKLSAGAEVLAVETVRLAELARRSLDVVGPQAREKGVRIGVAVPETLSLPADPAKLEQVLVNLLVNAVNHTPEGGEVTVEGTRSGRTVLIQVRDTGEGIPGEALERIFEPFVQARPRGGRRPRGTGLGLAICRQIVTLHGGEISVASEGPGRGATFTVRLPVGPQAGGQAA